MTIQCPGCKAHLAIPSAVACPRCSTPLPRPAAQTITTKRHANANGISHKIGLAAVFCCIPIVAFIAYRLVVPSSDQVHARQVQRALVTCQQAIQAQARFSGGTAPPYTANHGSGNEFYFAWPPGSFTFVNGFGAAEKMSASCIGDVDTGTITQLTINGRTIR